MRTEKYTAQEKELCEIQKALIKLHLENCTVCKSSFESYMKPIKVPGQNNEIPAKIPTTPPCGVFINGLREHIKHCSICNVSNKKWNEDSIPISDSMRLIISKMHDGKATEEEMHQLRIELSEELGEKTF